MVTKTVSVVYDDLTGEEMEEGYEFHFGFDDKRYVMDLTKQNIDALYQAVRPFRKQKKPPEHTLILNNKEEVLLMDDTDVALLLDEIAPWTSKARPDEPSRAAQSRPTPSRTTTYGGVLIRTPQEVRAVRAWARAQGMNVSDRGRMSPRVFEKYDAAHNKEEA